MYSTTIILSVSRTEKINPVGQKAIFIAMNPGPILLHLLQEESCGYIITVAPRKLRERWIKSENINYNQCGRQVSPHIKVPSRLLDIINPARSSSSLPTGKSGPRKKGWSHIFISKLQNKAKPCFSAIVSDCHPPTPDRICCLQERSKYLDVMETIPCVLVKD